MTQPDTADLEHISAAGMARGGNALSATAHAFATSVIAVAVGLGISVVVARLLGPASKGIYDLAIASAGLLAVVLSLALPTGITYAVSKGLAPLRESVFFVAAAAAFQFLLALAILAFARSTTLGAELVSADASIEMLVLIAAAAAGAAAAASMKAIVMGRQQVARASWIDLGGRATMLGLVVMAAWVLAGGTISAEVILGCAAGSTLATAVAFGFAAVHHTGPNHLAHPGQGLRAVAQGVRVALPSYASSVLQFLNYRLGLFIIAFFWSSTEVGLYALAVTIAQLIWLLSNAIGAAMFPRVAAARADPIMELQRTERFSRFSLSSAAVMAVLLAIVAMPLLRIVYGTEFQPAATPIYLLLPGIVAFAPVNVLASHLAGIGRPEFNLMVTAVSLAAAIALNVLLIPTWGMIGAAVATAISYVVAAIVMVVICRWALGSSPRALLVVTTADLRLARDRMGVIANR